MRGQNTRDTMLQPATGGFFGCPRYASANLLDQTKVHHQGTEVWPRRTPASATFCQNDQPQKYQNMQKCDSERCRLLSTPGACDQLEGLSIIVSSASDI
jgi:hypothetical protein